MNSNEIYGILFSNLQIHNENARILICVEIPDYEADTKKWFKSRAVAFCWYKTILKKYKNTRLILYQDIGGNENKFFEECYEFDPNEIEVYSKEEFADSTDYICKVLKHPDVYEHDINSMLYQNAYAIFFSKNEPPLSQLDTSFNLKSLTINQWEEKKLKGYQSKLNYIQKINGKLEQIAKRSMHMNIEFNTPKIPKRDINNISFQNQLNYKIEFRPGEVENFNRTIERGHKQINLEDSRIEIEVKNANGYLPIEYEDQFLLLKIKNNKIVDIVSSGLYSKILRDRIDSLIGNKIKRIGIGIGHFFFVERINQSKYDRNTYPFIELEKPIEIGKKQIHEIIMYDKIKMSLFFNQTKIIKDNKLC